MAVRSCGVTAEQAVSLSGNAVVCTKVSGKTVGCGSDSVAVVSVTAMQEGAACRRLLR